MSHNLDEFERVNQTIWDQWTTYQTDSDHHADVRRFLATGSSLRSIELSEMGDVHGKTLLHLLCNQGSDTLSWARQGAQVTGVDFSQVAINRARELAEQSGLTARFICSPLATLPNLLVEQFDVVYASYGVLCWMPDLNQFAGLLRRFVRPGGTIYLLDMHPAVAALSVHMDEQRTYFLADQPYFHRGEPIAEPVRIGPDGSAGATLSSWRYSLGEVVSALVEEGLHLDFLHEFAYCHYQRLPQLIQDAAGWWRWPDPQAEMPLLFSAGAHG